MKKKKKKKKIEHEEGKTKKRGTRRRRTESIEKTRRTNQRTNRRRIVDRSSSPSSSQPPLPRRREPLHTTPPHRVSHTHQPPAPAPPRPTPPRARPQERGLQLCRCRRARRTRVGRAPDARDGDTPRLRVMGRVGGGKRRGRWILRHGHAVVARVKHKNTAGVDASSTASSASSSSQSPLSPLRSALSLASPDPASFSESSREDAAPRDSTHPLSSRAREANLAIPPHPPLAQRRDTIQQQPREKKHGGRHTYRR